MPYDPIAPTEKERSMVFASVWIGCAASAVLLASHVFSLPQGVTAAALAMTGALVFVTVLTGRQDDYFNALRKRGLRWGMGVVALYLFAAAILLLTSVSYSFGYAAAVNELPDVTPGSGGLPLDGLLLATLAAFAYHLGFITAMVRGTGDQ